MFKPKLFQTLKNYNKKQFFADLASGVVVGIVAIPLAIAFAIASGVPPEKGLVTAIIAGFIISLLGGSNVQIGGPTGAFIVIVYGIIVKYGIDGLIVATIIAGIILIIMGLLRFGTIIQFIPYPVIVGFTSGIALIIFSSQVNDLLGLGITKVPAGFMEKWIAFGVNITHVNFWALGIGLGSIGLIILLQRINNRIPGSLVALLIATLLVTFFKIPVETIGSKFGEIKSSLPVPIFPNLSFDKVRELIFPAITIAMLAGIESLLSAVVADGMTGDKHHSNTELIAQGIANVASGIFGGIPATGAIARTATNIKNGGRTPIAGITHAFVLLLVLIFLGKYASLIPLCALSGILVIVAYNMSEWKAFKALLKCPKSDIAILLTTFLLTVIFDLTVAIQVGILLALLLFIRKMNMVSNINIINDEYVEETEIYDPFATNRLVIPKDVEVYEINGAFFFGAVEKFKNEMLRLEKPPKVRILRMKRVPSIDSSGLKLLEDIYKDCKKHKTSLILSGVNDVVLASIRKIGLNKLIGDDNILSNIELAINRSKVLLGINEPSIIDKIKRGGIYYNLKANDPFQVIRNAVGMIHFNPHVNVNHVEKSLIDREELMHTGIGNGIAIPHPRNPVIESSEEEIISICMLENEIDYKSIDGVPVHTAIFVLSSNSKTHLETISKIAKLCSKKEFCRLLKEKRSEGEIYKFIEEEEKIK